MNELSLGEFRVRTEFNPSNTDEVSKIKALSAELINLISSIPDGSNYNFDRTRLKDIAIERVEEASMWAVKASTAK